MIEQLPNILLWAALWGASWGIFLLYIFKRADYDKHFVWVALYFFGVSAATALVFRTHLLRILENFAATPFIVLFFVLWLQVFAYFYAPKRLKEPKEYFLRHPKRWFLTLNPKRLVAKSMDILAQQIFVILLVLLLQDAGLSLTQTIVAFGIFFGFVHAPLIFIQRGWPSWYFTVFSVLSAVLFPILILKVNYGFVYTYIIHWLFYTLTALGFWVLYPKFNILKQ